MLIDLHTHLPTTALTPKSVGLHPWKAATEELPSEEEIAAADAVGEIGLDKACTVDFALQLKVFEAQLALAEKHHKVVILHTVRAFEESLSTLDRYPLKGVVFHGFIGSRDQALRAVKKGYFLSFGARTERSPKTIEALRAIPLEHLFIETDEATVPLEELYRMVAQTRGIEVTKLEKKIEENYTRLFTR